MKSEKPLSDKEIITKQSEEIADFEKKVERLKKEGHTTHSCPNNDEDYDCHCTNKKIEDQNCWVIPKTKFKEIFGSFE